MRQISCGGRNPRSSLGSDAVSMCVSLFNVGATLRSTAAAVGFPVDAVARAVRRNIPNAWRRQTSKCVAMENSQNVVRRVVPHQVGWSTDPNSHHHISLPRLRCLEQPGY